jgi:hypothetical protein
VGKPWAKADLFFLKDSLQRGMSLVEIAGFLGQTADEVREKAKDLNSESATTEGRAPTRLTAARFTTHVILQG